jgi:acetate kinase
MKIVVLNAGSGSQKCSLFELPFGPLSDEPQDPIWEAKLDSTAPDQPKGKLVIGISRHGEAIEAGCMDEEATTAERTERLLRMLWEEPAKVVSQASEVDVVGHRVVHGGAELREAVCVTADVETAIERGVHFAPLHNPSNLTGIRVARQLFGENKPQFAIFDTAFHRTLSDAAATYAGPRDWIDQGIRRYGFHGTSFRYASGRAGQLLGRIDDPKLRLILCHLGGGCSLCATVGGRSIDTTMGFTPLDGIAMCTRSGALDPGILLYLLRQGVSTDDLEKLLNKQSGLKGLSGLSGDTRVLLPAATRGDDRARLAIDVFIHRLQAGIGAMLASLGDVPHALVFTDAIGESEPSIRAAACAPFAFLGLDLDMQKNDASSLDTDLATESSVIRVLLIKSREAWQIARECHAAQNQMTDSLA